MDNDASWWGYNYPKNLDKQEIEKLIVAQTVPSLRVAADSLATVYLNNVRVNGIVPAAGVSLWYLLGVLNSSVCDYVFRKIAKPKDGGYFEANKQFIAPLPIPPATEHERRQVAERAECLQTLHTRRRDMLDQIARRRTILRMRSKPESWLFPDVPGLREMRQAAPENLDADARALWARKRHVEALEARYDALGANLRPGVTMAAEQVEGELRFYVDGMPVVDRIYVADEDGPFIAAQWKLLAASFAVTPSTDGKKLSAALRKLGTSDNPAVVQQIIDLQGRLAELEAEIAEAERDITALLYQLYQLSPEDIRLVEAG